MRKVIKKVLVGMGVITAVVVILHIALFVVINTKGRDFILGGIKNNFGREATMESLSLKFPFNLEINKFDCEALSFKRANISLGFFNPFSHRLTVNKVYFNDLKLDATDYEFKIGKKTVPSLPKAEPDEPIIGSRPGQKVIEPEKEKNVVIIKESKPEKKKFSLLVRNLHIENSRLDLVYPLKRCPLRVVFDKVGLKVRNFAYPELSKFHIKLNAVLSSPSQASREANTLAVGGWVDYSNKNMDVTINVDNLDYLTFNECYPTFWQPRNLRLKEAVLSLESKLDSKDNDLTIDNVLTLEKIDFIKEEGESDEPFRVKALKTIISYLKGDKDKSSLHFKLIAKMNSPELDFASLKESLKGIVQIGPLNVIEKVVGDVKEKIKGTGDITVDSVVETLRDAGNIIKDMFKVQEEE